MLQLLHGGQGERGGATCIVDSVGWGENGESYHKPLPSLSWPCLIFRLYTKIPT